MELLIQDEAYPLNTEAYEEWRDYRKAEKGKPVGPRAEALQVKMLVKYAPEVQRQIIENSIMNSWAGLFAPKATKAGTPGSGLTRDTSIEHDLRDTSWAN